MSADRFDNLVSRLQGSEERKGRILAALASSKIVNEDDLTEVIRGRNIEQATSLFKEELKLSGFDASALAGLVVPVGSGAMATTGDQLRSLTQAFGEVVRREIGPLQASIRYILSDYLDPWEKIQSDSSSTFDDNAPSKPALQKYYGLENNDCMLLGTIPDQNACANIQRVHIWPKHTYGKGLEILELSAADVNSPRNYLLLQAEMEYFFDRKQFILLPVNIDDTHFSLRAVVIYPDLLTTYISIRPYSKKREFKISWATLNGQVSAHRFSNTYKPFLRLLAQHALSAMKKAVSLGVLDESCCSNLRHETIELARRSLGEDTIIRMADYNARLESLLVNAASVADEEVEDPLEAIER